MPTATTAPTETPIQVPTETPHGLVFNFKLNETNPVLEKGANGEWDSYRVYAGSVLVIDDQFHMFYTGTSVDTMAIGYAVSSDGLIFTKHGANPIFQADGTGFDASGVAVAAPLMVGDTWMLYYNGRPEGDSLNLWFGGSGIGLTTAQAPTGPWSAGQQVLSAGSKGEWDSDMIVPANVFLTEDGYRMYYYGRQEGDQFVNAMCGMATSLDGIQWTKYDDPETTEPPFAESDPISMAPSNRLADCFVLESDSGWEMFFDRYQPIPHIEYSISADGVHWGEEALTETVFLDYTWPRVVKFDSRYYLYMMNYDEREIHLATGTIEQP